VPTIGECSTPLGCWYVLLAERDQYFNLVEGYAQIVPNSTKMYIEIKETPPGSMKLKYSILLHQWLKP